MKGYTAFPIDQARLEPDHRKMQSVYSAIPIEWDIKKVCNICNYGSYLSLTFDYTVSNMVTHEAEKIISSPCL